MLPSPIAETSVALLALGIGALHMLAPDHWVPLTIYCHSKGLTPGRSAFLAAAGGFAHVLGSLLVMVLAIAVGFALAASFSQLSNIVVGVSFLTVSLYMVVSGLRAPQTEEGLVDMSSGAKWLVFATASSPELTIFPVYLSASVYGLVGVTASLSAFTAGTVLSIVIVTLAGIKGMGRFLRAPGRKRQIDYAIAIVMAALALFVLTGG